MERIKAKAISEILGITKQAVLKRAKKEAWPCEQLKNRAKAFEIAKLPEDIRIALGNNQPAAAGRTPPVLYKDRMPMILPVGSPELTDPQNRIALARADLIRTYLDQKAKAKKSGRSVMEASNEFIRGFNTGRLLPKVFEIVGKTARQTVEGYVKTYRDANYDYTALAPKWGNRKGQRKVTDEEFNIILSFSLHPNRLRISQAVRLTKMALQRKGIPSPSSPDTLRRSLEDWKNAHYDRWVFCREGEKALNDKCLPYLERDIGLLEVGEVLVADGHTLNFQLLHPFTGKPCRATMIVWYDWASCMPAGWEIMPTESVQSVAASLRRAILGLGKIPKVAYLDNGKAFKAKVFTDTDIDFEEAGFYGMFARLGIETIFAWPYNAQSKPVERFFGTFNELERLMPTYSGASIDDKPARMLRNERLHKRIHEKKYGGWVPTIEEVNRIIGGWVKEYANRPHRGLKGLCPGEVFATGRGPGVDEKALRHLMMPPEIKPVHRNGISFLGRNYYDAALYGLRDRVLIKYDFEDLSRILVYDMTGAKLICVAEPVRGVHPIARISGTKDDLEAVKEGIRRKKSLKKGTEHYARFFVDDMPDLIQIPERIKTEDQGKKQKELPQGEAERIEAEAGKMKVLELRPKQPTIQDEAERYETLLEQEMKGESLITDDLAFMRYFERTELYASLKGRFEFLKETFALQEEGGNL